MAILTLFLGHIVCDVFVPLASIDCACHPKSVLGPFEDDSLLDEEGHV